MSIIIKDLPEGISRYNRLLEFEDNINDELGLCKAVECDISLNRVGTQIDCCISYFAYVKRICARCLKEYEEKFNSEFEVVFKISTETIKSEDDIFFCKKDEDILDFVKDFIYEDIIINEPLKSLCSKDCKIDEKYLGKEKSNGDIDPRWEKLLKLKDNLNQ